MSIVAINMASQPIIGFIYGAKASERVKETLRIAQIAATVISVGAFMFVQAIPGLIEKLFKSNNLLLYSIAIAGLRTALFACLLIGFQLVTGNIFQAVGKARIAALLPLLRQVIIFIPFLYSLPGYFQLKGIWSAFPIADTQ